MEKIMFKGCIIFMLFMCGACTKYNYMDGGLAYGKHDCSMWEYLHKQPYDWDSTILMIQRADMVSLFDGTGDYKKITFFGVTNHSIRRYMQELGYEKVQDLPVEFCRRVLERLILPEVILRDEFPRGNRYEATDPVTSETVIVEEGGHEYNTFGGQLFIYSYQATHNDVPETGEITIHITTRNQQSQTTYVVASSNIETTTGVVQALEYNFRLENI